MQVDSRLQLRRWKQGNNGIKLIKRVLPRLFDDQAAVVC